MATGVAGAGHLTRRCNGSGFAQPLIAPTIRQTMQITWCWKCRAEVPLFDETEWLRLEPLLRDGMQATMDYRRDHQVALVDVDLSLVYKNALDAHEDMTGTRPADPFTMWHHRRADFGPPCTNCGRPLRTPGVTECHEC